MNTVILRAVIVSPTLETLQANLESTDGLIWLTAKRQAKRYGWRGVPCRELDILIEDDVDRTRPLVIEVSSKTGRYDGAVRTRFCVRSRCAGMDLVGCVELQWSLDPTGIQFRAVNTLTGEQLWGASYRHLDDAVTPQDAVRIVGWHQRRYYRMIDAASVDVHGAILQAAIAAEEIVTLTAANRLASRMLYEQANSEGWRKLTLRQQESLGLTGQWHHETTLVEAYARRDGKTSPTRQWTLESAQGPEMAALHGRAWRDDVTDEDLAEELAR